MNGTIIFRNPRRGLLWIKVALSTFKRHCVTKVLTFRVILFVFTPVKIVVTGFLGDLTSNFDCILPDMTNILCRKKGMSKEAAWTRAATMEGLERHVRTAAGTSTSTYKNVPGQPPCGGEGQGKADSMAAWTLISSIMLTSHKNLCHGIELIDVTGKIKSRRTNDMYVDESDGYASAPDTNTVAEAISNMQNHAQVWAVLVAITGGLLAFHKCHWQILAWAAVGGYYLMMSDRKIDGDLSLKDHKGKTFEIPQKNALLPNPGLGFLLCPNGDQSYEFKNRLAQVKECASRIRTAALTIPEAWLALVTRVLPRITYPFGLTRFTKTQLHMLSVVLDNTFLLKLGINRNMPRVVVYGPNELGGISYPSLETIQDQKGISLFLRQLQWDRDVANDLRILLSRAQLDSGLMHPIMDATKTRVPYLEEGLISHLRDRLGYMGASIVISET